MPPSLRRSSATDWIKQACGCGRSVRGFGFDNRIGVRFDVRMVLAGAVDAIGPVEAGVEPLRGVRRRDLPREHEAQLVEKRLSVINSVEIMVLPAPIGPGTGQWSKT